MTFAFEPTLITILKLEVIVFVIQKKLLGFSSLEEVNDISGRPLLPPLIALVLDTQTLCSCFS